VTQMTAKQVGREPSARWYIRGLGKKSSEMKDFLRRESTVRDKWSPILSLGRAPI